MQRDPSLGTLPESRSNVEDFDIKSFRRTLKVLCSFPSPEKASLMRDPQMMGVARHIPLG